MFSWRYQPQFRGATCTCGYARQWSLTQVENKIILILHVFTAIVHTFFNQENTRNNTYITWKGFLEN